MDQQQQSSSDPPSPALGKPRLKRRCQKQRPALARFIFADHRYVFLGTSTVALAGMWFSSRPRSSLSFMAPFFFLELVMYYLLVAWLIFSGVALLTKLGHWGTYSEVSPFAKPRLKKVERCFSYLVWVVALILFVDRAVMGFFAVTSHAIAAESMPDDSLSAAIYMLYEGRALFATGIMTTVELAIFGTAIAFVLALLLVFLRLMKIDRPDNDLVRFGKVIGSGFARFYSAVVRGTPMMVQALIIYNAGFAVLRGSGMGVTQINGLWSTFVAGLVTVSLNSTAYMMEVLRGGIESVDIGQTEAARSLGLSQWQAMRKVVFPQGIRYAIPGLSNELVINIKDSSVLSVIGVVELMFESRSVAGIYYRNIEVYMVAAVFYLILTMIATWLLNKLSQRMDARELSQSSDSTMVAATVKDAK
ncbi:MAG: amino acid ABC transporter permease [Atopobium sp.]|jgi:putative lysine transport system permease protein|nr:amino acid ABC transporter permease [Atopobium sp.]